MRTNFVIASILTLLMVTGGAMPFLPFGDWHRLATDPIISPQDQGWQAAGTFNPAVAEFNGKLVMLYRAQDKAGPSRLGYADSSDDIHFQRRPEPVLSPETDYEKDGGVEDPRLVKFGDTYYLTYTGYNKKDAQLCLATSKDLVRWERKGVILPAYQGSWNVGWTKSGAIVPRKLNGKYWVYFLGTSADKTDQTGLAYSSDLVHWSEATKVPVLPSRGGKFDSRVVEPGPPPILAQAGIILIYNGADDKLVYRTGVAIFARDNPARLLWRSDEPIFSPELVWEKVGQDPNVVFVQGMVAKGRAGFPLLWWGRQVCRSCRSHTQMMSPVVLSLHYRLPHTDVHTSFVSEDRFLDCIFSRAVTGLARLFECLLLLLILVQLTWTQTSPRTPPVENTGTRPNEEVAHARELLKQGKYDEAIAELRQLSSTHPAMEGISHELGVAYYKKSDYTAAIEQFKQALEKDPHDSEATQLLGLSYYLSGKPVDAIPLLERVQAWYPRANVDASYILGQCYIQTKDYPHARVAFAKMFDLPPESAGSYLLTARMLFRREFEPVALDYVQKATTLDPKLPLAHFLSGEIHLFQSQVPEAIKDFEQELALNPGHAPTYYRLGDAYSRLQKFDEAERILQRSIWLDPTSTGPYILMGKVLEKKGEPELAVRALQRAASMDPNNSITHHLLGQAYRDLGQNEDAERELKIANQLQSSNDSKP
jgi:predicted GH43/DUF377 family glycosyl hydrolase/tetratricopeptide (TPR) repeat protein